LAVLSVGPRLVHCPEAKALGHVRAAVVGLIEEGIAEGRRQAGTPSPEALASAHEAGIAVGWARALAVAVRQVEARQEAEEAAKWAARRCADELRAVEAVRGAISEAMPRTGGYDE
jgi:hypothetical protein